MLDKETLRELAEGLALRTKAAGYLLEYMTEAEDEEQKKALLALLEDTMLVMSATPSRWPARSPRRDPPRAACGGCLRRDR